MSGESEGRSKEDLEEDLVAFSALIDSDDDFEAECLSQESVASCQKNETPAKTDADEVDYDALNAMLECSDDEDEKPKAPSEPSQQEIEAFLGDDDSDDESEVESSQEPTVDENGPANLSAEDVVSAVLDENSSEKKPAVPDSAKPADPNVDIFMDEYEKMEAMMAMMRAKKQELEQKGLVPKEKSPNTTTKSPTQTCSAKASTSSSPKTSQPLKDLNLDLFSKATEDEKCPTITKPGRPRKKAGNAVNMDEIKPTNFYKNQAASSASLMDDDDSDWEGMDGEKPSSLSKEGEEVKRIMKRADGSRLAHTPRNEPKDTKTTEKAAKPASQMVKKVEDNSWKDPFSGMRITKPLVSEATMSSRMEGRRLIKMSKISNHARKNLTDVDWVTIGCIVGKSDTRTSAKGSQYMIWTLSDLEECENSIKLFLFGQCYKQLWKERVGTVIGLLNPSFMANEEKTSSGVALTVDNWQKILKLGDSRDYGVCKATTKAGKTCFNFINRSQGDYCTYHVQSAYKKACSKRSELQAGYSGPQPKSFMNKIFQNKNDTYYYGGQMFTAEGNSGGKKQVTANSIRSTAQGSKKSAFNLANMKSSDDKMLAGLNGKADGGFQELLSMPTRGSMNLLKHLSKEEKREQEKQNGGPKTVSVKPSDIIKQTRQDFQQRRKADKEKENTTSAVPQLGRGFTPGMEISFDDEPVKSRPSAGSISKAAAIAKLRTPLTKNDPNATKKKKSPEMQDRIRKRLAEAMAPTAPEEKMAPAPKKPKILGGLDLQSEEVQKLLKAGSSHRGAVAEIESEREDKYFAGLEKQETMEQKMLTIKEIKVTVVSCKVCRYTIDGKPKPSCVAEHKHALSNFKATKKFFQCVDCKEKTSSFDKYPNKACEKCGGSSFEKTSMCREKKGPLLENEKLLLRGEERKYINS